MSLPHRSLRSRGKGGALRALLPSAVFALSWYAGAVACLWDYLTRPVTSPLPAPAAVVLVGCGLFQAKCALRSFAAPATRTQRGLLSNTGFWQALALGAVGLYLVALVIGPVRGIGWAWLAAVAVWQSLLTLPLATSAQIAEDWLRWIDSHRPRRLNWLVAAAVLGLVVGEMSLTASRSLRHRPQVAPLQLASATRDAGGAPAEFGPFTLRLDRLPPVRLRVALLGESGSEFALKDFSYQVRQFLPAAEVVSLNEQWDDRQLTSEDLAAAVCQSRPDVVLAILPACDDAVPEEGRRNLFDWRQFELAGLLSKPAQPIQANQAPRAAADDFEGFLQNLKPQLSACRTPLDARARSRWQRTYAALDRVLDGCLQAQVELAVVVVPAELQLNAVLRNTLLRRSGLTDGQFDVDLPQRQLASYAQQRALPMVDLLPALRLCSQPVYERNTTQLSEPGSRTAAAAICGWLESRFGDRLAAQLSHTQ